MGAAWDAEIEGEYTPPPVDPDNPHARKPHWIPLVLSRADVAELLNVRQLDAREALVLRTLYATGMRDSELVTLVPEALDPEKGLITLHDRAVPVDGETMRGLAELDWSGWGWTVETVAAVLEKAAKRCKVGPRFNAMGRELHPRTLRFAFATHALENGAGLFSLHHWLGFPKLGDTENVIELAVGLWRSRYDLYHPLALGVMPLGGHRQADLEEQEVQQMIGAAKAEKALNGLIVRTIYSGGLRVNELTELLCADIDVQERRLFIRDAKEAKDRYTLVDRETAQLLADHIEGKRLKSQVFPVLDSKIRRMIKRAGEVTGVLQKWEGLERSLSPHSFRHAHASHLYQRGLEPAIVRRFLGHKSVEETMGYVACGPVEWRKAYDKCGLLHQLTVR